MEEPVKDWGFGIPKYTESDVLKGLELHAFCTNIVAQNMQNDGYTIEGVILDNAPTQVIANKNGKQYFVIVAGGVFPHEGKISFEMKLRFSNFCKKQGVIPMFAPVGLASNDPIRFKAGLALKYDGYYIKYTGNEDLSNVSLPTQESVDYKDYCVEKIIHAYETGNFDILYDDFADDIQFHSQWVLEPLIGKKALIDYYNGKGQSLRKSSSKLQGDVVVITENRKLNGNVILMSETGKVCALMAQQIDGKTNWIFISPKFNENNKLIEIALNDPDLFSFMPYYAF